MDYEMKDVTGFMIDMDGTVCKGNDVIKGAPEFIGRLKRNNIPFTFLTNNSSSDREHYLNKLLRMGFDVTIDNILTSTTATIEFIMKYHAGKTVYPMGTPKFVQEIKNAGIRTVDSDPDIVLLAFDTTITYEKINNAYRSIRKGAAFIVTHPDDLCPTEDCYDLDAGPFMRLLESMTDTKATVIGKPNPLMAEMAAEKMNVPLEGTVMVGDRIYTDMKMASDSGIRSILVLSGEAKADDIRNTSIRPTMIVGSVDEILR
ncbi:MAG: HAD-IIA family hydrolase [Methanomassiliicoccaceae archaeon]|nr:HAD-IIA family hydrolase [Methanomassiliicoccaceae archaeon]